MEASKNKIFINCEEAYLICDKSQYNESTWWERFRLNIRLMYCGLTKQYSRKNSKLTRLVTDQKEVVCMPKKSKEVLKGQLKKQLQNQQ